MPPDQDTFEATGGIDPAAFSADLFPADTPSGDSEPSEGGPQAVSSDGRTPPSESSTPAPTQAAEGAAAQAGLSAAEYDALPKSWKKEMEAEWKAASPALRKYAHEREAQVTEGISRYRQGADQWSRVTSPFAEVVKAYPDVNISEILATLASNHIQMIQATPEQRRVHAMALARGYGVDLTPAQAAAAADAGAAVAAGNTPDDFSPGQMQRLQSAFGPAFEAVRKTSAYVEQQIATSASAEVDKFFSDPKNEFVNEVADDILALIKTGKAEGLPEAYELAVMRNPAVKGRYPASLAAKNAPPAASRPKLPNVKSTPTVPRSVKPATIDDTIAGVIAKHFN